MRHFRGHTTSYVTSSDAFIFITFYLLIYNFFCFMLQFENYLLYNIIINFSPFNFHLYVSIVV